MSRLLLNALSERCYPLCAVGYRRTRAHLLSWRAVLPGDVKQATVCVSRQQQEEPMSPHSGTWLVGRLVKDQKFEIRLFLYENIPQLRYHNPDVKFSFEAHKEEDSRLCFTTGDGTETYLVTTGLRQKEIQALIQDLIDNFSHDTIDITSDNISSE